MLGAILSNGRALPPEDLSVRTSSQPTLGANLTLESDPSPASNLEIP